MQFQEQCQRDANGPNLLADLWICDEITGNTVSGSSSTYYGGQQTIYSGSHDTAIRLMMLNPGDRGFEQGVDARMILGADWEKRWRTASTLAEQFLVTNNQFMSRPIDVMAHPAAAD